MDWSRKHFAPKSKKFKKEVAMQGIKQTITAAVLGLVLSVAPAMASDKPGKGTTLNPARATWNTGFFQEALVRRGLEDLGYKVKKPKDLANPIFYKSLALGDLDCIFDGICADA